MAYALSGMSYILAPMHIVPVKTIFLDPAPNYTGFLCERKYADFKSDIHYLPD